MDDHDFHIITTSVAVCGWCDVELPDRASPDQALGDVQTHLWLVHGVASPVEEPSD